MKAKRRCEHAGSQAYVVVDPVWGTGVVPQSWHMRAYPDAHVRDGIKVSGLRIWLMLIHGRGPVNRDATQNQAKKDGQVQPVAASHQEVVPANYTHAGLTHRRACSDCLRLNW
jgi:hypothetical protein